MADFLTPSGATPEKETIIRSIPKSPTFLLTPRSHSILFTPTGLTPDSEKYLPPIPQAGFATKAKGPTRKALKFPEIDNTCNEFISNNSFSAHAKRADKPGNCGLSLQQITEHALSNVAGLGIEGISPAYIHRRMPPPNKRFKVAELYSSDIAARVPAKRNCARTFTDDGHFYSSRVKLIREFAEQFSDHSTVLSCDNKNKIVVGNVATDRRQKIRRFYSLDDPPNMKDHDFKKPGYLIVPMGYITLPHRTSSSKISDEAGRPHFRISTTGPLTVVCRAQNFFSSTIEPHVNDLLVMLRHQTQSILVLIVDNGPDWSSKSLANCVFFARLFKRLALDIMFVVSYAPSLSSYNPVEHSWSLLTNSIPCLVLPDNATPADSDLPLPPKAAIRRTDAKVLDTAMIHLTSYWDGLQYDSHPVSCSFQNCISKGYPYSDHDNVAACLKTAKQLKDELAFTMMHLDRRYNCVILRKCVLQSCSHCLSNPVKATSAVEFLRRYPCFPRPTPSAQHPGHFQTFLEQFKNPASFCGPNCDHHEPDSAMPAFRELKLKLFKKQLTTFCSICKGYRFRSEKDKKDHHRFCHSIL